MSGFAIGLIAGLFIGTMIGYFIAALMVMASDDRRRDE